MTRGTDVTAMLAFKQQYKEHKMRVMSMVPTVNDKSKPKLKIDPFKIREALEALDKRVKENMGVFMNIASMSFVEGKVQTYHKEPLQISCRYTKLALEKIKQIEFENNMIGKRLVSIGPTFSTFDPAHGNKKKRKVFKLPKNLMRMYKLNELNLPKGKLVQKRLLRPVVYFDLAIQGAFQLGRITIQLYTEAAPQVVCDFIRAFKHLKSDNIRFLRGFLNLWVEGEIVLDANAMSRDKLEYDVEALDHRLPGVLSFGSQFLDGFKSGFLNFTIAFRPLQVPSNERIAFGRVIGGVKMLDILQEFSTKSGSLKRKIIVSDCGLQLTC